MSKAKLEAARELIRSKQYAEARAVLRTMADDATARKWLARLDEIAPEQKPTRKRSRLAGVLALVVLCGVIALLTPRQPRQPAAAATSRVDTSTLPAASMSSQTPAPSLTITQTLSPSPTFTAAPSLTVTSSPPEPTFTAAPSLTITQTLTPSAIATPTAALTALTPSVYYIRSTANVRACPRIDCAQIEQLQPGSPIIVSGTIDGDEVNAGNRTWYQVDYVAGPVYIYSALVTQTLATTVPPTRAPLISTLPPIRPLTVDCPRTCAEMSSCDQAYTCLRAGHDDFDRDGDGVPCENICPGG